MGIGTLNVKTVTNVKIVTNMKKKKKKNPLNVK